MQITTNKNIFFLIGGPTRIWPRSYDSLLRSSFLEYLWGAFSSRCGACRVCWRVSKLAFFSWVIFGLCI